MTTPISCLDLMISQSCLMWTASLQLVAGLLPSQCHGMIDDEAGGGKYNFIILCKNHSSHLSVYSP